MAINTQLFDIDNERSTGTRDAIDPPRNFLKLLEKHDTLSYLNSQFGGAESGA